MEFTHSCNKPTSTAEVATVRLLVSVFDKSQKGVLVFLDTRSFWLFVDDAKVCVCG